MVRRPPEVKAGSAAGGAAVGASPLRLDRSMHPAGQSDGSDPDPCS